MPTDQYTAVRHLLSVGWQVYSMEFEGGTVCSLVKSVRQGHYVRVRQESLAIEDFDELHSTGLIEHTSTIGPDDAQVLVWSATEPDLTG